MLRAVSAEPVVAAEVAAVEAAVPDRLVSRYLEVFNTRGGLAGSLPDLLLVG